MIGTSLEPVLDYAKKHNVSRVMEVRCSRCDQTIYAVTDDDHENMSLVRRLKNDRSQRYVHCKRCGYGMFPGESTFVFKTHEVGSIREPR